MNKKQKIAHIPKDQLSTAFIPNENTIDPRDKHLITINKDKKLIITEVSDLKAQGISPVVHHYTIGGDTYVIWVYSPKSDYNVPFKHQKSILNLEGEQLYDVFVPDFPSIWNSKQIKAQKLLHGWELHILND